MLKKNEVLVYFFALKPVISNEVNKQIDGYKKVEVVRVRKL